jgi:hypothetical protein
MNGSATAACALVACETEFLVRRIARAFEVRRITRALERAGVWVVPLAPAPVRVNSRRSAPRWHLLLSIVAAAGAIAIDPAAATAQCGGGCGGFGSCGSCGSGCGGPSFFGSPPWGSRCGGSPCCGSPCGSMSCGSPCCGSPCGSPMPYFGSPGCGCRPSCGPPMGCCGGCGSPCGCQRASFAFFPMSGCGPVCGPRCGPPCGCPGVCSCGPSCGLACGPACGCGMPGCGTGGCGSCGPVAGTPSPTFESAPSGPLPSSSNKPGPLPSIDPGDGPPTGPPAPIKQRPLPPDGSDKFQRQQPQGSLDATGSIDLSQVSADPAGVVVKRFFRQTVSAGFHTRVALADAWRRSTRNVASRKPANREFEEPRIVARTD